MTRDEVERYVRIVQHELAAGESFGPAYRSALIAVLTSKNFYYIEEGDPTKPRDTVNDWELASRLSYFLWSSMPDNDLFAAVRAGTLKQPEVFKEQLKRMTADPKICAFRRNVSPTVAAIAPRGNVLARSVNNRRTRCPHQ